MPKTEAFERYADRYESWFERHAAAFHAELNAIRTFWPPACEGLEVGAGAGHFAASLGIAVAVEPSAAMRRVAVKRGIHAVEGTAEHLPFPRDRFDAVLMVTTLCFVDDPAKSVREMLRVLRPGGCAVVAFVVRDSPLGLEYEGRRDTSVFYRDARFFTTSEVSELLFENGFRELDYCQTLFVHPDTMLAPDPVRAGFGEGSFVVIRGRKPGGSAC